MKKTLLVVALVAVFVMAMAGSAFAAYSTSSYTSADAAAQPKVGDNVGLSANFAKASTDATIAAPAVTAKFTIADVVLGTDIEVVNGFTAVQNGADVELVTAGFQIDALSSTVDGSGGVVKFLTAGARAMTVVAQNEGVDIAGTTKSTTLTVIAPARGATAAATQAPSVIGANGATKWSYSDLADSSPKYEGGYLAFTDQDTATYANPHGGYDTATNKCKVCHAVHRAEGAYYLLRADSQDDACDYCHVGASAHSSKVVYDNGGTGTANGHTIGASTYIPDSTTAQWTEGVTLQTVDAVGATISETIEVRAYSEGKNDMFRFGRHHGHSIANGGARRNYVPVGPLALRCMNCHQVHNADYQTWKSISMAEMGNAGEYEGQDVASYKLLKQSPSGSFYGVEDAYGQIPIGTISIVPETTLTAGVNFDSTRAQGDNPTALTLVRSQGNMTMAKPVWVAQAFDFEQDGSAALAEENFRGSVNNAALSVWCADCHNLNIGGTEEVREEFGFKAHTERTHPAPYTGAHSGPAQCYSCHRADLPRINTGDSCSQCHYGTGNYKENRYDAAGAEYVASDFPHSGDGSYKMLGNYSIVQGSDTGRTTIDNAVTVGADNLDAVCIRCHGGIGTYH